MTDRTITLIIVDDHPVVRDGLRGMFDSAPDFEVLGEASNGVEAVELAGRLDPDVVLVDLRMPGGGGVDAIAELARRGARSKVLVLTTYDTDSDTPPRSRRVPPATSSRTRRAKTSSRRYAPPPTAARSCPRQSRPVWSPGSAPRRPPAPP